MDGLFFFFHRCQRPGRGAGGSAGGALASMKQKNKIAGLALKMTPWGVKIRKMTPGGSIFFFRSQPSELAQTRRSGQKKELDELV